MKIFSRYAMACIMGKTLWIFCTWKCKKKDKFFRRKCFSQTIEPICAPKHHHKHELVVYECIIWSDSIEIVCAHSISSLIPSYWRNKTVHKKKLRENFSFPFISTFCKYLNKSENNIEAIWRTFKRIKYIKYWMEGNEWKWEQHIMLTKFIQWAKNF